MVEPPQTEFLVPFDGSFRIADAPTGPQHRPRRDKSRLKVAVQQMDELQKALYADDRHALLLIFQGMDAAGKDSTIRAVMQGINPAGCQVFSFKKPSQTELDHDFLWRLARALPERGRIGIFNRSHYEEVLVVRVHPEILESQRLPNDVDLDTLWQQRFQSIRGFEEHLARNGTVVVKFWLNVSRREQKKRFLSRLESPEKHWKFKPADIAERRHWDTYMNAYEAALNETSRPWAPWYAIPADSKPFMRACVAEIIVRTLQEIDPQYPIPPEDELKLFEQSKKFLEERGS